MALDDARILSAERAFVHASAVSNEFQTNHSPSGAAVGPRGSQSSWCTIGGTIRYRPRARARRRDGASVCRNTNASLFALELEHHLGRRMVGVGGQLVQVNLDRSVAGAAFVEALEFVPRRDTVPRSNHRQG